LVGRRPRGIAILAVLQVLASLALLVGGLILVIAASLPPSIDVQGEAGAFALGTVLILLGVLSLIVAWGLWTLQPWARKVAMLFAIVSLGTDVVSIVTGNYENAVALLIDLLLIWYLTRPTARWPVKRACSWPSERRHEGLHRSSRKEFVTSSTRWKRTG